MLDADSGLNIIDDSHNHRFPSCGIQLLIVLGRTKELLLKGWAFPQNLAIMIIPPACLIMKKTSGKA